MVKLLKSKDKRKILKAARERCHITEENDATNDGWTSYQKQWKPKDNDKKQGNEDQMTP